MRPSIQDRVARSLQRHSEVLDVERDIKGLSVTQRHASRQVRAAPLVASLERWMRGERGKLSRHADVAKAMDYMLNRWDVFTRSSMTAGFASPTMQPNGRCAALASDERHGSLPDRTEAVDGEAETC